MKKLTVTLLVAVFAMFAMSSVIVDVPPMETLRAEFVIRNQSSGEIKTVEVRDFSSMGTYDVNLSKGVYEGDELVITYNPLPSIYQRQAKWTYSWGTTQFGSDQGLTAKLTVTGVVYPVQTTLTVVCSYYREGQSENATLYTMYFKNVKSGHRVTVTNSEASKVQVSYANYEEVSSAGQRAAVSLYDIYGNLVSTGYLDAFGTGTLSTKGKPGIYVVKVTMDNQVVFSQRIQVK